MEKDIFYDLMKKMGKEINISFSVEQIENFYKYMELLLEWNQKMNLTAITEPKEIILKHFIDSLTILEQIKGYEKIVDVGTGAGFPGIPISIMNSRIKVE